MRRGFLVSLGVGLALSAQPGLAQSGLGAGAADLNSAPLSSPTGASRSPVLLVDFTRAMEQSLLGQQFLSALEAEGDAIAAENRQIEAELIQEEQSLTEQRATMEAEAFRALANAFDSKVQTLRAAQDAKERAFTQKRDEAPRLFHQAVLPILQNILVEQGASVVFDRRVSVAYLSSVDVTDLMVERLNRAVKAQNANASQVPDAPGDEMPVPSDE